jgi:uncharacterized protein YkwD
MAKAWTRSCMIVAAALAATPAWALDLNSFRAQNGLPAMTSTAALSRLAQGHAADLARRQAMDHNGFQERMGRFNTAAENVAYGCDSADCVFQMWAGSPGHRANMLRGDIRHYGLASAKAANGQRYWVLELSN